MRSLTSTMADPARRPPRAPGLEHSLAFLADPYRFIGRHCDALGSEVIEVRLLLRRTLCLRGAAAAQLFYDEQRFVRAGAAPEPVRATLFGAGGVQSLDGAAHRARKHFFVQALGPEAVDQLLQQALLQWHAHAAGWARQDSLVLYPALQRWLADSVCAWAGVPWPQAQAGRRTQQLVALFDRAGSSLAGHFAARRARKRLESWLAAEIVQARQQPGPTTVLRAAAALTGPPGELLPPRVAAVELLNVLRPTVAVSVFIVFLVHALHQHPDWLPRLREDLAVREAFVQEVRRWYPFFPAVAARVARDFEWAGLRLRRGERALLDLHGTNQDPRRWEAPARFDPERFLRERPGPFELVPQGGAQAATQHRCPGEDATMRLMLLALRELLHARYTVPPQDLALRMDRLPPVPRSGMVLEGFQPEAF